jgi:hypothetical protein
MQIALGTDVIKQVCKTLVIREVGVAEAFPHE